MARSVKEAGTLAGGGVLGGTARKQLASFAARIGSLLDQKVDLDADIKEVFKEAGDGGFDTKILRKAVKRVRTADDVLNAEEEMIESYVEAIKQPDLLHAAA